MCGAHTHESNPFKLDVLLKSSYSMCVELTHMNRIHLNYICYFSLPYSCSLSSPCLFLLTLTLYYTATNISKLLFNLGDFFQIYISTSFVISCCFTNKDVACVRNSLLYIILITDDTNRAHTNIVQRNPTS